MSVNQDYRAAECYENVNTICGSIIKLYRVQIKLWTEKIRSADIRPPWYFYKMSANIIYINVWQKIVTLNFENITTLEIILCATISINSFFWNGCPVYFYAATTLFSSLNYFDAAELKICEWRLAWPTIFHRGRKGRIVCGF